MDASRARGWADMETENSSTPPRNGAAHTRQKMVHNSEVQLRLFRQPATVNGAGVGGQREIWFISK